MHRFLISVVVIFNIFNNGLLAEKSLAVARIFGNNMVLQREINAPVWGSGTAGDIVSVEIDGHIRKAKVNKLGKWMIRLPKLKAGGPYVLKAYNRHDKIEFKNVLVGDVWLASGQSNMQMSLSWGVNNMDEEIRNAIYPAIRFFTVANDLDNKPQADISGGSWTACTPESVKDFSAIGYFFARQISAQLNVPIGILNSTWGGTDIQAWMSEKSLQSIPKYNDILAKIITQTGDFSLGYEQFATTNKLRDSIIENSSIGFKTHVFAPEYNDSKWNKINIPCTWNDVGLRNFYGYVWLRKHIVLKENDKELLLNLGDIAHENRAFVNGFELQKLGNGANVAYIVPTKSLKIGDNLIALQILGRWAVGGFASRAEFLHLTSADKSTFIKLADEWKYNENIEPKTPEWIEFYNYPSFIYNAKIAPIIPYGLKGILWYQGENNAKNPVGYANYFSLLVNDWRKRWKEGNVPVIYGQLSNCKMRLDQPADSKIALLRNEQVKGLELPNTAMVINIDLGLADGDVHFTNKQEAAMRFANTAMGFVYRKKIAYKSPVFKSFSISANQISVKFLNTYGALKSLDDKPLKGFAIACEDKIFVWAHAKIEGNKVVVWNNVIKNPKYVRYGWADNPECNLYNAHKLPVIPFRTDD